ncbi:MAG TPA: alpha/beta fold hydrolase [Clostridiaceae bacterium]
MNKKIGCLIIHGFAGNLKDIEKLNRFLLKKGFETSCPLLKGHALTKKDLARTSYSDWISSAEESLMELSKKSDRVVLIGFSMGGLIAFNLAIKHDIYKMVTLSAPIYHWDLKRMVTNIINDIKIRKTEQLRNYIRTSTNIPFRALLNFKLLLYRTKPLLSQITCPIYIAQGLMDDTVKHKSANYIYRNVASTQKIMKFYNNSPHVICNGPDFRELCADIKIFIDN